MYTGAQLKKWVSGSYEHLGKIKERSTTPKTCILIILNDVDNIFKHLIIHCLRYCFLAFLHPRLYIFVWVRLYLNALSKSSTLSWFIPVMHTFDMIMYWPNVSLPMCANSCPKTLWAFIPKLLIHSPKRIDNLLIWKLVYAIFRKAMYVIIYYFSIWCFTLCPEIC